MDERIIKIEANIDNMNPEFYGHLLEIFLTAGANDAWLTPIIMKKGRPGILLSLLCDACLKETIIKLIFEHTTTIGLRFVDMERTTCERKFEKVMYEDYTVHIKKSYLDGKLTNVSLEYEDLLAISKAKQIPLKVIEHRIWAQMENFL